MILPDTQALPRAAAHRIAISKRTFSPKLTS
jgi:hypothetical protein